MKKLGIATILALTLAAALSAQAAPVDSKGAMGLQFTISGLGTFGVKGTQVDIPGNNSTSYALVNYGIGGKYFVMDKLAVGAGLFFAGSSLLESGDPSATKESRFSVKPFATYTLLKKGLIALNAGGFLSLGFANTENPILKTSASVLGFGGTIGAECFIMSGLSLGANYEMGANYYKASYTTIPANVTTTDSYSLYGISATSVFLTFYL